MSNQRSTGIGGVVETAGSWSTSNKPTVAMTLFSFAFLVVGFAVDYLGWAIWGGIFGALAFFFFGCTIVVALFIWLIGVVSR